MGDPGAGSNESVLSGHGYPGVGTDWTNANCGVYPQHNHVHFYGALNLRDGRETALWASQTT